MEQVVLYEVHRLICFANEYESDFIKAMVGRSAKVAENERIRKKKELDSLLARDRELLYELSQKEMRSIIKRFSNPLLIFRML